MKLHGSRISNDWVCGVIDESISVKRTGQRKTRIPIANKILSQIRDRTNYEKSMHVHSFSRKWRRDMCRFSRVSRSLYTVFLLPVSYLTISCTYPRSIFHLRYRIKLVLITRPIFMLQMIISTSDKNNRS